MEEPIQRLWNAFTSVQQVPADQPDQRKGVALPLEEITHFVQCAHRCCFANARPVDSETAAKKFIEGGSISLPVVFDGFDNLVDKIINDFFPVTIRAEHAAALAKRGSKPLISEDGVLNVALLTPLESALRAFAESLTDDREPNAFLPYDQVLVLPSLSRSITAPFRDFVTLERYAPYPAVYTAMWRAVAPAAVRSLSELEIQTGRNHDLSPADFLKWFVAMYRRQIENFTPSRAEVAGTTELQFLLRGGEESVSFATFVEGCKRFAINYAHALDTEAYLADTLAASQKECAKSFVETTFATVPNKTVLKDPSAIGAPDELDADRCEESYLAAATENRVLVSGPDGSGKSEFARSLASKLKAVYVDTFAAAVAAYDNPLSTLHEPVKKLIAEQTHASTELKAALVKSILEDPATVHRGYVIDDIPVCDSASHVNEFLVQSTLCKAPTIPRILVKVQLDAKLSEEATAELDKARHSKRDAEIERRNGEASEAARKAEEKAARQERREKRAAKAERKAKIEAGEIQPGPEDVEPEGEPAAPEEEEEEPVELDDEGNPMEPEAVVQRDARRKAERERRILLEDLQYFLLPQANAAGRRIKQADAPSNVLALPALAKAVSLATARRRVVQIGGRTSSVEGDVTFVMSLLSLQCSCIPQPPSPSDEPENPDGSADNDVAIADANWRTLSDNTPYRLSKWRRYCPVTYADDRVLVEGSMVFAVVYRGRIYNFASKEKMQRFIAQPHPFIQRPVTGHSPILLFQSAVDTLQSKQGLSASDIEHTLAHDLGLTSTPLAAFAAQWAAQRQLVKERNGVKTARQEFDAKQKVLRDDRLKKRLEAEAKKKKKDEKKKPAKKKEEDAPADDAPAEETAPEVPVETTEDRIKKVIAAEQQRNEVFLPLLVSTLSGLNPTELQLLFEERVLPPTVVVIDYEEPRPEGEEEAEPEVEEDAEPAEELDEDGNPKPKPPPKPFDPTDPKQYRKAVAKLLEAYRQSTEASATDPEPAAEGQPAPKPFQAFNIVRVNAFGKSSSSLCSELQILLHPLAEPALPPQDGEDILPDPEIEEGNPDYEGIPHPSLIPIPKAINQFGKTLRFCPVTLHNENVFVTGDPALWLTFKAKKYMFASQAALDQFRMNPYLYAKDYHNTTVPPRLWIVGAPFSGKKTLGAMITSEQSVPQFSLEPEYLRRVLAAALSDEGAMVDGVFIPSGKDNRFVQRAAKFNNELLAFDADQIEKLQLKERTQQEQTLREEKREAGEDVEDLDESEEEEIQKILEFEPEEPEAKEERESKLFRQMGAALTRIEPFATKGYVLLGRPNGEVEAMLLLDEGAYPDAVIYIKSTSETFVNRQIDAVFAKRSEEQQEKQAQVNETKRDIQIKQREAELRKWRRRNIGADDEPAEEIAEPPEDVEPVTMDGVRADLEAQYETESGNVAAVVGVLPERRVPLLELNGDGGTESLLRSARNILAPYFTNRRSLLQAAQVITYDEAVSLVTNGVKMLSSFEYSDPVHIAEERQGRAKELKRKQAGKIIENEPLIPEPEPEAPKPKKMKKVTKVNDEGEEYEVEEEDLEEEAPAEEEPEAEPLEPEPEYSPEELEDMAKEHQAKVAAIEKKKQLRAAILGHRVYFFHHYNTLGRFLESPMAYWDQPAPLPKVPGTLISVLEDTAAYATENSQAGKVRSAAEHLAFSVGAVLLSLPKVLQWGLLHSTKLGSLGAECVNASIRQAEVPTATVSRLLHARLRCSDVQLQGAVLLNLPRDTEQVDALDKAGILLSRMFQFGDHLKRVSDAQTKVARVVEPISSTPFSTAALRSMVETTGKCLQRQQGLVLRTALGFPAPVAFTTTTEAMIKAKLSPFQTYCPTKWVVHEQLQDIRFERQYCVTYLGHYFVFSSKEAFDDFHLHPDRVSGEPTAPVAGEEKSKKAPMALPSVLPTHFSPADATSKHSNVILELAGCCPVTLYQTRFHTGLKGVAEPKAVPGDKVNCLVEYDKKYYAIANLDLVSLFLEQPWVFAKFAVLPHPEKLPFDAKALRSTPDHELYIRRMLREPLAHAILAACQARPKYPGLSPEESALKFIALHLKANNTASAIPLTQYKANFALFERESTLYKTITTTPPEDAAQREQFGMNCDSWDQVQDAPEKYQSYIHLRKDHETSD